VATLKKVFAGLLIALSAKMLHTVLGLAASTAFVSRAPASPGLFAFSAP
jgi:hypothetical protein